VPAERGTAGPRRVRAFAPGRINLIGEHTDYNEGLALPFAIEAGVRVAAEPLPTAVTGRGPSGAGAGADHGSRIVAVASDLGERDEFSLPAPPRTGGWRGFVRGVAAELAATGLELDGAQLQIEGDLPQGAGLSSSAALAVAVALALVELAGPDGAAGARDRLELARLCSRVENEWVGARTGLLDQLASLFGEPETALRIDFATLRIERVPLALGGWRLAVVHSGESHALASSGYNERRRECERASELLGVQALAQARIEDLARLPEPLRSRARHVLDEDRRVTEAVDALHAGDVAAVAALLNASHASLRDLYEVSTDAMERTVRALLDAGADGARMIGGGFGGSALAMFAPGIALPARAREVRPGAGARVLEE
jgi:galactokinase